MHRQHCENAFLRSLYSKTFRPPAINPNSAHSGVAIASQIGAATSGFPCLRHWLIL